ncbi:MAG: hypothetical protein IJ642_06530 [Oscillospiraceae bacterium]|nr:hypothetical protein [Oscillospiraceae bacterium]
MQMDQYQNIVVINITHGKYTNYWVYRADTVNPEKEHGYDSLPVYLSALRQAITQPEVHKRGNGEDQHLYYIPMGNVVDLEKAKKIAFSKFAVWKQPWETMPEYVAKFIFRKKQNVPARVEIFRKKSEYNAKSAYLKAYHRSVFRPYHPKGNQHVIIYWHGSSVRQITEEITALVYERWLNPSLSSWL